MDQEIENIFENFDWGYVFRTMSFLNWQWAGVGVPSIAEMKKTAYGLLSGVWHEVNDNNDESSVATGGFEATATMIDGVKALRLTFVLASWESPIW